MPQIRKQQQQIYEVEDIIDESVIDNEPHYLVKWVGWSHQFDTWEPLSSLGNIIDYLKYWLQQRRFKYERAKEKEKGAHFHNFKHFIDRQHLQPKRKSVRQQYAEEEELQKKKLTRQRYGEKLLKKKKTWEKYLQYDRCHVDLVDEDEEEKLQNSHQPESKAQEAHWLEENNMDDQYEHTEIQQHPSETKQQKFTIIKEEKPLIAKMQQQNLQQQTKQSKSQPNFKVVAFIDPNKITKIRSVFSFKGIKCAQVEYQDGRLLNMKQQDIQQTNPKVLQAYNQSHQSPL